MDLNSVYELSCPHRFRRIECNSKIADDTLPLQLDLVAKFIDGPTVSERGYHTPGSGKSESSFWKAEV